MPIIIILTLLLAPAYVIHIKLGGLPGNILMLWVVLVWIFFVGMVVQKNLYREFAKYIRSIDKKIITFTTLFFLAGLIASFVHGFDVKKLGTFIVLFFQPISLFFIFGFEFHQNPKSRRLLLTICYLLLASAGLYAILQYFTLLGLAPAWWGNSDEPKRALAFFIHPNFYALFAAPLLALLIPDLAMSYRASSKYYVASIKHLKLALWVIGAAGLLLSLSRAGWLGLAAAVMVYFFLAADKKIKTALMSGAVVIALIILITPILRYRVLLPFYGEKSTVSRLSLWRAGWRGIEESPLLGLGLDGFSRNYSTLNTDPNIDTHNYPHNIFLDVWVETGILGLVSFIAIVSIYIYRGLRSSSSDLTQKNNPDHDKQLLFSISLFLIALIFQGQIDNPYFKNDLAMVFWIILALTI